MYIYDWIQRAQNTSFRFDIGRVNRSEKVRVGKTDTSTTGIVKAVSAVYQLSIKLTYDRHPNCKVEASCTCEDYRQRYALADGLVQPCKHLIALMKRVEVETVDIAVLGMNPVASIPTSTPSADSAEQDGNAPFAERLSARIADAVNDLSRRVVSVVREGRVPFLVGPTGCGKTSAVSQAALILGARFVEMAGADSWTDSDLVGVIMPNGTRLPGPIGSAMMHVQLMEEPVLLFLDEFLRLSPRAQESMMRILLPKNADIAQAMGIDHDGPIRVTSAPFWGEIWSPAEKLMIVLAANPWGNIPDSALLRRVEPISVDFSEAVLALFQGKAQSAIEISWKGVKDGSLPLPIEYGELSRATDPHDISFLDRYAARLQVLDPAAATGFLTLLNNTSARSS
ncbi:MAG: AAA family ATPase [Anaerolineales bacterium]|nr:MAG: AAA family ATPase [Anaerolineales bacterium]